MRIGVVTFPGSLDDRDAARAVRVAGGAAVGLWHRDADLHGVDAVVLPGGFSHGDYLRCGAIAHLAPVMGAVKGFAARGGPVLGICNGFQILCESGLLPGALLRNEGLRFTSMPVELEVGAADTVWTGAYESGQRITIPLKNGEGRYHADDATLDALEAEGRVVVRYLDNPNGSARDIAGVANEAGNVVGLMPHPGRRAGLTVPRGARLPRPFRWLWAGFGSANLADGILLAAGPLLVTSITLAPAAVAGAVLAQRLPWLVFGLLAGEVVDRTDRRRLMIAGHVVRALLLAVLVAAVVGDRLTLELVYGVFFLLGTAETFADNAGSTLVAAIVPDRSLGAANARLVGTRIVSNQLAGPPLGAFLFAVGIALPFTVEAALFALAAVMVARLPGDTSVMARDDGDRLSTRLVAGARWLRHNPPVRRLAIVIALFNVTFGATYSILVLYAFERLGLDEAGFGLLLSASAVGGLAGAAVYERLEARFSYATLLRAGLVVESATHLLLGATTSAWFAAGVLVAFGVHEATWGSLSQTIRLRATPAELQGRVNGIYLVAVFGPLSVGAVLAGWLAEAFGLLYVFWVGGAGAALTTVWAWRGLADLNRYEPTSAPVR